MDTWICGLKATSVEEPLFCNKFSPQQFFHN